MKRHRWLLLGLILVLLSWAPGSVAKALASYAVFDTWIQYQGFSWDGNSYIMRADPVNMWSMLPITPTESGFFSREETYDFAGISGFCLEREPGGSWEGGTFDPHRMGPPIASFSCALNVIQDDPLRFTDLTWGAKILKDGIETTLYSESADFFDCDYDSRSGGGSFILEECCFIFSLSGNVIDVTTVPIPSALLLLGSGLIPLALYGRGKLVRRN
jgi:hypothetical protein